MTYVPRGGSTLHHPFSSPSSTLHQYLTRRTHGYTVWHVWVPEYYLEELPRPLFEKLQDTDEYGSLQALVPRVDQFARKRHGTDRLAYHYLWSYMPEHPYETYYGEYRQRERKEVITCAFCTCRHVLDTCPLCGH